MIHYYSDQFHLHSNRCFDEFQWKEHSYRNVECCVAGFLENIGASESVDALIAPQCHWWRPSAKNKAYFEKIKRNTREFKGILLFFTCFIFVFQRILTVFD